MAPGGGGGFFLLPLFLCCCCCCFVVIPFVFFVSRVSPFKAGDFPGLIPLIECYLSNVDVDIDTHCTISQYLELISRKASGESPWVVK